MDKKDKELKALFKKSFTIEELKKHYPKFNRKGKNIITRIIKEKQSEGS